MDAIRAGQLLRQWRKEKGWSQQRLADISGVSPRQIQDMESGARSSKDGYDLRPRSDTVRKLADAFGMPRGIRILEIYGYPEQIEDFEASQLVAAGAPNGFDRLDPDARQLVEQLISLLSTPKGDKPGYLRPLAPVTLISEWAARPTRHQASGRQTANVLSNVG